jgi:tRNA(adenine34) deaminase
MLEDKVKRTIEQLRRDSFQTIAAGITQKRMAWLDRVLPGKKARDAFTPRDVFELLFFEQMGLERDKLPVISETDEEIVWLSYNPCSLLKACQALGLDTRKVCRPINEKATQAFVSRINPELRFHRSYEEIRPYADYCREKIIRVDFAASMRIAMQEAHIARSEGNEGHGAVVVLEDRIIGQAHDTVSTGRDPSQHAEVNAIRQAVRTLGDANLCGAILFSTCEPCPMCAALAVWADVTAIVYGVSMEEMAALGRAGIQVKASHITDHSPSAIEIIAGVLHDECRQLYG